jgi:hypothetical protein
MTRSGGRIAIACVLLLTAATPASAQTTRAEGSTTLDRVVSPRVVSTYVIRGPNLALLVLWRGTPGWFKAAGAGAASASAASGGFYTQTLSVAAGGLNLKVDIDHTVGIAQILDRQIRLTASNLVLVDNVDAPSGPEIADVLWIEPTLPPDQEPLSTLLRRSPQLEAFLQCDAVLPDLTGLTGFSTVCHRLFGR